MTIDELIKNLAHGETLFNNGSKSNRIVKKIDGMYIYYLKKDGISIASVRMESFAKWARGTGLAKRKLPMCK